MMRKNQENALDVDARRQRIRYTKNHEGNEVKES